MPIRPDQPATPLRRYEIEVDGISATLGEESEAALWLLIEQRMDIPRDCAERLVVSGKMLFCDTLIVLMRNEGLCDR